MYNDDGDAQISDGDAPVVSPDDAVANSDATASEIGSPQLVIHPDVANLLRGGASEQLSLEAQRSLSLSQAEAQVASELASQETDYDAAFSPVALSAFVDNDALHVELAAARKHNDQLQAELKKAQATIAELKKRLDANNAKRSEISKECSDLRAALQPKRLEAAKTAARSDAVVQAVDIISKHDMAIEAQSDLLRRMHSDLLRMRQKSSAYLEMHKKQFSGPSDEKSRT